MINNTIFVSWYRVYLFAGEVTFLLFTQRIMDEAWMKHSLTQSLTCHDSSVVMCTFVTWLGHYDHNHKKFDIHNIQSFSS